MFFDLGEEDFLELDESVESKFVRQADNGRVANPSAMRKSRHSREARRRIVRQQLSNHFDLGPRQAQLPVHQPVSNRHLIPRLIARSKNEGSYQFAEQGELARG
jgi:hypothetical protein